MTKKDFISLDKKVYDKIQTHSKWKPLEYVTLNETELSVERRPRNDSLEDIRLPSLILASYYIIIRKK